jgi:hypothetical protein
MHMACSLPQLLDFAGWELGVQCPRRAVADPTARIEKLDLSHSGVTVIPMVRIAGELNVIPVVRTGYQPRC